MPEQPEGSDTTTSLKIYGLYIDGEWVEVSSDQELAVINPATEELVRLRYRRRST